MNQLTKKQTKANISIIHLKRNIKINIAKALDTIYFWRIYYTFLKMIPDRYLDLDKKLRIYSKAYRYDGIHEILLGYVVSSWDNFRAISGIFRYAKDYKKTNIYYENLIKSVGRINEIPLNKSSAFILSTGRGADSLNCYRKVVSINNEVLFEKVYKRNGDAYKRLEFYRNEAFETLVQDLDVSVINSTIEGECAAIVYYEWRENLIKSNRDAAINTFIKLRESSLKIRPDLSFYSKNMTDFSKAGPYYETREKVMSWLMTNELNIATLLNAENYVSSNQWDSLIFSHGDFGMHNSAHGPYVFDFDMCGMYPSTYEVAKFHCQITRAEEPYTDSLFNYFFKAPSLYERFSYDFFKIIYLLGSEKFNFETKLRSWNSFESKLSR